MEQINTIELIDPSIYPTNDVLEKILGDSFATYLEVLLLFDKSGLKPEWRYYRDGKAWLCKVVKGKKTIVWMSAWKAFIKATVYFPERLVGNIVALDISEDAKKEFSNCNNVGKSKPFMFRLDKKLIMKDFEEVIQYKIGMYFARRKSI